MGCWAKNNILIKLSKDNLKESLNNAFKFMNNINLENTKVIDARIKNQIILNDWRIRYWNIFIYFTKWILDLFIW